jgi:hypothetical protein
MLMLGPKTKALPEFVWVTGFTAWHGLGAFALPGATLPDCSGRKPSGIPVARLAGEPGAVVSSSVPPRTSLGGAPLLERSQRQPHARPVGTHTIP